MTDRLNDSLQLLIVLSRAHQWVAAHVQRDIRQRGLNPTEFGVLELLYHKGEQPLQQIGEKILMTSGNITYVIDKLADKGMARRKACPTDRRVIFAEITEEGRKFMEEIFPSHAEAIRIAVDGLSDSEKEEAIRLLRKLGLSAQASFG